MNKYSHYLQLENTSTSCGFTRIKYRQLNQDLTSVDNYKIDFQLTGFLQLAMVPISNPK